jgi:hypothetical protein
MLAGRRRAIRERRPRFLIAAPSATVASAAEAAGVTITAKNIRQFDPKKDGDPLDWVVSKNLKRRHLDESQRAMVMARLASLPKAVRADSSIALSGTSQEEGAKIATLPIGSNQHRGGSANLPTQAAAAAMLNVSARSNGNANAVHDKGTPELQHAVEQGHLAISLAAKAAKLLPEDQIEIAPRAGNREINLVRYRAMNCNAPPGEAVRCRPARPSP